MTRLVTAEVVARVGETVTYRAPEPLGQASIRYYALALGADPDRWVDEAPPTLVTDTCQLTGNRTTDPAGYLGHGWDLPFPVPCTLIRGGNDYRFLRPVRADDTITTTWELTGVAERSDRSGRPLAVATALAAHRVGPSPGEVVATNTETLLYRPVETVPVPPPSDRDRDRAAPVDRPEPTEPPAPTTPWPPAGTHPLPDLTRRLDLLDLVRYGAATWDWHRLHYDPEFAAGVGMDGPVADGQLLGALLAEQVLRAAGPAARLTRLRYRNRLPVPVGSTIVCEAAASPAADGSGTATIEARIRVGDRVVVAPASAGVTGWTGPGGR